MKGNSLRNHGRPLMFEWIFYTLFMLNVRYLCDISHSFSPSPPLCLFLSKSLYHFDVVGIIHKLQCKTSIKRQIKIASGANLSNNKKIATWRHNLCTHKRECIASNGNDWCRVSDRTSCMPFRFWKCTPNWPNDLTDWHYTDEDYIINKKFCLTTTGKLNHCVMMTICVWIYLFDIIKFILKLHQLITIVN